MGQSSRVANSYHPASNGLAKHAVQTFKIGIKKMTDGSLETKLARFKWNHPSLNYRSTTNVWMTTEMSVGFAKA